MTDAVFRADVGALLNFEDPAGVPTHLLLDALRHRLRRLDDLADRWSRERQNVQRLALCLDAVSSALAGDDVDRAKRLLREYVSEAAPGAEGTHGAGPGAAAELDGKDGAS